MSWKGKMYIDSNMRTIIFTAFGILGGVGSLMFLLLSRTNSSCDSNPESEGSKNKQNDVLKNIASTFKRLSDRKTLHLVLTFSLTGFAYSFLTGVHPTAVGNTKQMKNPMSTVGLVGISSGVGEGKAQKLLAFCY